jgi:hypothetical protein
MRCVPLEHLSTFNGLHGLISQKIVLFEIQYVFCKVRTGLQNLFKELLPIKVYLKRKMGGGWPMSHAPLHLCCSHEEWQQMLHCATLCVGAHQCVSFSQSQSSPAQIACCNSFNKIYVRQRGRNFETKYTEHAIIFSHVWGSVTDNNGLRIGWLDLLALL